nr:MAG TPA: hypothetical protein [Caudoviricetes sp.]
MNIKVIILRIFTKCHNVFLSCTYGCTPIS